MDNRILIYGATGYTGKLFTKYLIANKIRPILAGRSSSVGILAQELDCEARFFDVDHIVANLTGVSLVVNLAGSFKTTQKPLIEGCLKAKVDYIDIAGEYSEVEDVFKYNEAAKKAGITIMPAAGFGVSPTDIAAKIACNQVPNAIHLTIAYATKGGASRGTLKTVLKDINKSGIIRKNGVFEKAKPAMSEFPFLADGKTIKAVYNPWRADLFTANKSNGIENIETYSEFPPFVVKMMKGKLGWLRKIILRRINLMPEGPSEKQLQKGKTYIHAIAKNSTGLSYAVNLKGPEAYLFTVACLYKISRILISHNEIKGVITPSSLGTEWLKEIEGVEIT